MEQLYGDERDSPKAMWIAGCVIEMAKVINLFLVRRDRDYWREQARAEKFARERLAQSVVSLCVEGLKTPEEIDARGRLL